MTRAPEAPEVRVGQVWADNDPRSEGRTLRVDSVEDGKATCTILTNSTESQKAVDASDPWYRDMRGKVTRISLSRFKPNRTGYRCVQDRQFGIRYKADGPVFAFSSREIAEEELRRDDRGIGVLMVHEYEPGVSRNPEWREVGPEG